MKKILYNLGKYLMVKFCQHEHKELIWKDVQERYLKYKCPVCWEDVYEDI